MPARGARRPNPAPGRPAAARGLRSLPAGFQGLWALLVGAGCAFGTVPDLPDVRRRDATAPRTDVTVELLPLDADPDGAVEGDTDTPAPETSVPETSVPETSVPETSVPDTAPGPDAEPPCRGECLPGMAQACGNCGSQRCGTDCRWGPCVGEGACRAGATQPCGGCGMQRCTDACAWGACTAMGACSPGMTRPCGRCGTQRCTDACDWGACSGEGPCTPGATQAGSCDRCAQQTCGGNCQWGGCALRPGNACEYRNGVHNRGCSACRCGLQWCLPTCQWSTACTSCCTSCGGCQAP
jgi:hypothetical protein